MLHVTFPTLSQRRQYKLYLADLFGLQSSDKYNLYESTAYGVRRSLKMVQTGNDTYDQCRLRYGPNTDLIFPYSNLLIYFIIFV